VGGSKGEPSIELVAGCQRIELVLHVLARAWDGSMKLVRLVRCCYSWRALRGMEEGLNSD
jgi:hypothetical protein